jgi:diguanylate cyclase (GGDEF)-like protein
MLYTGVLIIVSTILWDWTSLSENRLTAIYYRIPAAIAVAIILIPIHVKPFQKYLVDASLTLSFISFCCLAMNYLLLPERTPYLPAIAYYFMSSFLILAPIVPRWKILFGLFIPVPVISIFLFNFNQTEHYSLSIFMHVIPTHAFLLLTAFQVKRNAEHNYILFCQTYQLATLDSLTNLLNRRAWEQQASFALERSSREHTTFAVVTGDIDLFKHINDNFGHPVGDAVIKSVASCLKQHLRNYDLVGRLGGEEFVIALPNIDKNKLNTLCERMRSAIEELVIYSDTGERVNITISIGISFIQENSPDLYQLMKQSDVALYKAKNNGRNRVESYTPAT